MKIAVCIKQVPGSTNVEIDEETGVLKRDGSNAKVNPYDLYAIETALYLKEKLGGTVTAVSMGPDSVKEIMQEAYMMGVDEGYIFSDRRFAGSDVLATAYTLSEGLKTIGSFDLIICGKQTTDGDTAQIGPAIAEYLKIPHAAWVKQIEEVTERAITVEQNLMDITQVAKMAYPCLITVEKGIFTPRLPSYKRKLEMGDKPVHMMSFDDFPDQSEINYGLKGSPTNVERIFPPKTDTDQTILEGTVEEKVQGLFAALSEKKYI